MKSLLHSILPRRMAALLLPKPKPMLFIGAARITPIGPPRQPPPITVAVEAANDYCRLLHSLTFHSWPMWVLIAGRKTRKTLNRLTRDWPPPDYIVHFGKKYLALYSRPQLPAVRFWQYLCAFFDVDEITRARLRRWIVEQENSFVQMNDDDHDEALSDFLIANINASCCMRREASPRTPGPELVAGKHQCPSEQPA